MFARCRLDDGRRCTVWADEHAHELVGRRGMIAFSRTDAAGGLREARLLRAIADRYDAEEHDRLDPDPQGDDREHDLGHEMGE